MEFMFLSLGDRPKGLTVLRSNSYHFLIFDWRTFLTRVSGLPLIAGRLCRTEFVAGS